MQIDREKIRSLFPEIEDIKDEALRKGIVEAWAIALKESEWESIEGVPWIPGRAEVITNIQHVRAAARIGMAIVKVIEEHPELFPEWKINPDIVIAGCLLHDVGKLLEYTPRTERSDKKSDLGKFMGHHILGAYIAIKAGLPPEVVHCIEAHRERDPFERTIEAEVVRYSDLIHAYLMQRAHPELQIF